MKRKAVIAIILLMLLFVFVGCHNSENIDNGGIQTDDYVRDMDDPIRNTDDAGDTPAVNSPNTYLPQVMIDGEIYYLYGDPYLSGSIPELSYTGTILSTVPLTQMVSSNGQANFDVEPGAPYARYGDGYAVLWHGVWTLFVTESDLLAGVAPTPQQVLKDAPERAPRLKLVLMEDNSPEQRVQAIQLTTSWNIVYEDGTGTGYESDSAHPLQIRPADFEEATLQIGEADGEIVLLFSDNYPPESITARRWNAMYAIGSQDIRNVIDNDEPVDINENIISFTADTSDYVYEIHAAWSNGSSYYAFRTVCGVSNDNDDSHNGSISFSLDIQTEHYEYIDDDLQTDISIDNLVISGYPDKEIEQRINQTLENMAWMDAGSPIEEGLYYHVLCDYTLLADRLLCARYSLYYYSQSAVHPWRSLNSITIDLETGQEVSLDNIMVIDERMQKMLIDRGFDLAYDGESEIIGFDEGVLEEIDMDDFYWQISTFGSFALSENSVMLIVFVPHVIGDYWVLAFPYEILSELLLPWFALLVA